MIYLKALIAQSVACKQKIKHVCSSNGLTNLSSWTGRNGVKHTYWSGDRNASDKGIGIIVNCIHEKNTFISLKDANVVLMVIAPRLHISTLIQFVIAIQFFQELLMKDI